MLFESMHLATKYGAHLHRKPRQYNTTAIFHRTETGPRSLFAENMIRRYHHIGRFLPRHHTTDDAASNSEKTDKGFSSVEAGLLLSVL